MLNPWMEAAMNISILTKLKSKKLWMAVSLLVLSIGFMFGIAEDQLYKLAAILAATADVVAYLLAESYVDGKRAESSSTIAGAVQAILAPTDGQERAGES